jgi:predicted LPLAT superfamily acyltransferase
MDPIAILMKDIRMRKPIILMKHRSIGASTLAATVIDAVYILTESGVEAISSQCTLCKYCSKVKRRTPNGRWIDSSLHCEKFDREIRHKKRCNECIDAEAMFNQYGKLAE